MAKDVSKSRNTSLRGPRRMPTSGADSVSHVQTLHISCRLRSGGSAHAQAPEKPIVSHPRSYEQTGSLLKPGDSLESV